MRASRYQSIAMFLGSARLWRAGERHQAFANFSLETPLCMETEAQEVRCGGTPQPARGTRALPNPARVYVHGSYEIRRAILIKV